MAGRTVLILGGGFGGLATAQHIRRLLPREHRIVVVERRSSFYMCAFNMHLIAGEIKDSREGERELSELPQKGIEWVQGEILEIDPKGKKVRTSTGTLEGDYLIVALGAEKTPQSMPGFAESAHNFYEVDGAIKLNKAMEDFESGRIIVLVCSTPFSCPAAPCEVAFLFDSVLRRNGKRQSAEIAIYTPEVRPLPAAGADVGSAILNMLKEKDIRYYPQHKVKKVDSGARKLIFDGAEASFDLLVGVPPHTAPQVVKTAGLTDETGWVPVDLRNLETPYPGVFAIGDITSIKQPNPTGLPLPKAWVFAEEQGHVVAENVSSRISGGAGSKQFDGKGFCYLEAGNGTAAYGSGDFYAYPTPRVYLEPPSQRLHKERRELEQDKLKTLV